MRVMLTSVLCPKGDVAANLAQHLELLSTGTPAGCDLVLLPEMSLTGYRAAAAIRLDSEPVASLVRATADSSTALSFGLAEPADSGLPHITQVVAAEGQLVAVHRKAHLGEDEDTEFQPGVAAEPFAIAGTTCAFAVCAEIGTEAPYAASARVVLAPAAPGLYEPRRRTDADWRRGLDWWRGSTVDDARRLLRPRQWLAVSTQAGATDDEDFPGWAALIGPGGVVSAELPDWREGALIVEAPPG